MKNGRVTLGEGYRRWGSVDGTGGNPTNQQLSHQELLGT